MANLNGRMSFKWYRWFFISPSPNVKVRQTTLQLRRGTPKLARESGLSSVAGVQRQCYSRYEST